MCGGFRWGREGIDPLPALFCNLAGTRFLRGMAPPQRKARHTRRTRRAELNGRVSTVRSPAPGHNS